MDGPRRRGGPFGRIEREHEGRSLDRSQDTPKAIAAVDFAEMAQVLDLTNIVIHDQQGKILFWTTGCQRLYGWTATKRWEKFSLSF